MTKLFVGKKYYLNIKKYILRTVCLLVAIVCLMFCTAIVAFADSTLTDEELYQDIDQKLKTDARYEGRLIIMFAHELPYEQAVAALEAAGVTDSEDSAVFYTLVSHRDSPNLYFRITADEQQLRDLAVKLWRIEGVRDVQADEYPAYADNPVAGDLNADGEVDTVDYMMLKRAVLGTYTIEQNAVADLDGNGEVDTVDYMILKRIVLGTYFPAE